MADAAWTPPASDAVWTPPAEDAVDNAWAGNTTDADTPRVGWAEENLAGPGEVIGSTLANVPYAAAHSVIDMYRRVTGGDTEAPDSPIVSALRVQPGAGGRQLLSDIKSMAPGTKNGLDVSDEELRSLDPSGKKSIEQLRAEYKQESEKSTSQMMRDSGSPLGAVLGNTSQVVGDVGNIAAGYGALKSIPDALRTLPGAATDAAAAMRVKRARPDSTPPPPPSPDVGTPLSGDDLRAQPNPVPFPEGTLHRTLSEAGQSPAAPPSQTPAQDALAAFNSKLNGGTLRSDSPDGRRYQQLMDAADAEAQRHGTADENGISPVRVGERVRQPGEGPTPPPTDNGAGQMPFGHASNPAPLGGEAGGTTVAPTPTNAAPEPSPAVAPGRLFNEPAKTGPQEAPTPPDKQIERAGHLDALDNLSNGGLPTRRESAIKGDYNATGDDYQAKEVGSEPMRQQIASENAALHKAAENVHNSIGSEFPDSVDSQTLDNRGRVIRNAIHGIQGWFDKATDQLYDTARTANQGRPIAKLERVSNYLNDDSNFTNDAEIGLQRAAKQRLNRLWTTGDPDGGVPPGSVNAAERFREFLNDKGKNPSAMGVASDLKNHLDMDVAEHGGPGLFETARAMRRHSYQMLEEPTGIKKLLAPSDSQGINHAIPTHKVADYIADLPTDQHAQIINVLKAGAHLGSGELADASAAAIRELQAHVASRMHAAGTNADGTWNARKFYNSANQYARNMPKTFEDRPNVLKNMKVLNDAGNTLAMDKHYPGAAAQGARTGLTGHALELGGALASGTVHHIPVIGRPIGKAIESGVERATGKLGDIANDKAVKERLIDRNGNRVGSGKPMNPPAPIKAPASMRGSISGEDDTNRPTAAPRNKQRGGTFGGQPKAPADKVLDEFNQKHPTDAPAGYLGKRVGSSTAELYKDPGDPNTVHLEKLAADQPGGGHGTAALREITDLADKHGARVTLDAVPQGKNPVPRERLMDYYARHGFQPDGRTAASMTREPKGGGSVQVPPGMRGSFSFQNDNPLSRATAAPRSRQSSGGRVIPNERSEYNANSQMAGPRTLSDEQNRILGRLSGQTGAAGDVGKQSTAGSRNRQRGGTLNIGLNQGNKGEPGFRQMSKQEATGAVESTGAKVTKATVLTPEKHGVYEPTVVADTNRPLSAPEMQQVLAKTKQSAIPQRTPTGDEMHVAPGHEQTAKEQGWDKFNKDYFRNHDGTTATESDGEKPLEGAPEGDRPNGNARAVAEAYKKSAGIDTPPLKEYRYIDPDLAKSIADAYDKMEHNPSDPKVKKAYDAFKAETLAQYEQMQKAGVKVDLDKDYPYVNPREMHEDVRQNNHMSIYPTEEGFGTAGAPPSDHPMLEKAPVKMGGKDATYNDLFRAVHDYYGHAAEGSGFRANGEYNAWRAHRSMYSAAARPAMDAETLGQNSWVNSNPLNKGASSADTIYAEQKAGLLPPKVVKAAEEGVGADEHHITNQLTDSERAQLRSDTTKRLVDAFHSTPVAEEYAAAAMAGAAKRGWYKQSSQAIVNTFGHEAPRFAALLSAMSPQVSVQTNFANALRTYVNWDKEGRPTDPSDIRRIMEESSQKSAKNTDRSNVLDAWVNNGVRALTADDPSNVKLSGPKVHSFYNNLTDNVNEVTNDAWMASFAKIDPAKLGGGLNQSGPGKSATYLALSGKVRAAASLLSRMTGETWTPAEVQETVWSWAKTAYEHAEEKGGPSIPELVKNGDITDELIRSTPDFHQLFSTPEHRGLLQSSRFAGDAERVAPGKEQSTNTAGTSQARQAAQEALRPHLISAAERLEALRQERRASGKSAPKED